MRCSKCPPTRCCEACGRINKERVNAGLLKPIYGDIDHPNNAMVPLPAGGYRGARPVLRNNQKHPTRAPVITAYLKRAGSWYRGCASLNGNDIYVGKPTRNKQEAWDYASQSAGCIRDGLDFDRGYYGISNDVCL